MTTTTLPSTTHLPTIHSNGTSHAELLDQQITVCNALREARDAIASAAPNGRDYYLDGTGQSWIAARAKHENRCNRLMDLLREFEADAQAISDME